MEIQLRKKYRTQEGVRGYKAKPRTGNSSGVEKHRKKTGTTREAGMVMRVGGATGSRRMERL